MNSKNDIIYVIFIVSILVIPSKSQNYVDTKKLPCGTIVERYYECKHLKMKINELGKYEIDSSVLNNQLNESFYESILGKVTLEQALDLQRDIYLAGTDLKCSSQLCRCMREFASNYFKNSAFGFALGDKIIYPQVKQAIISYVNESGVVYPSRILSISLENFCKNYDFIEDALDIINVLLQPSCFDLLRNQVFFLLMLYSI